MPVTVLKHFSFNPHSNNTYLKRVLSTYFQIRNWGIQSLTNLPKVIQLAPGQTVNKQQSWNWTQATCLQSINLTIATELTLMWNDISGRFTWQWFACWTKGKRGQKTTAMTQARTGPLGRWAGRVTAICCGQQRAVGSCGAIAGPPPRLPARDFRRRRETGLRLKSEMQSLHRKEKG